MNDVLTTRGSYGRSNKYSPICTQDILSVLFDEGFKQTDLQVSDVRSHSKAGYQKHLLRLTRDDLQLVDGVRPEIVLINSHDGSNALKIFLGAYRFVCENGLMTGTTFDTHRITHIGRSTQDQVRYAVDETIKTLPMVARTIENWSNKQLGATEKLSYAFNVAKQLTKGIEGLKAVDTVSLLKPKRTADEADDLFTVYNVVQENAMSGGLSYVTEKPTGRILLNGDKEIKERNGRLRRINAIDKKVVVNRFLWDEAAKLVA